jgi:hypothetical protein
VIRIIKKQKMKTKFMLFLGIFISLGCSICSAQGFQPPASGKAVVYFVRATGYGFAVKFQYFHNDKFIGEFAGMNYLRYECDAGKQLFWAVSENKEFLEADLNEGGTYIIKVNVIMGAMKARVGFTPVSYTDTEQFQDCRDLIVKNPPKITPEEDIEKTNLKLGKKISENLKSYETTLKNEKNFRQLTADMAIPPEGLK